MSTKPAMRAAQHTASSAAPVKRRAGMSRYIVFVFDDYHYSHLNIEKGDTTPSKREKPGVVEAAETVPLPPAPAEIVNAQPSASAPPNSSAPPTPSDVGEKPGVVKAAETVPLPPAPAEIVNAQPSASAPPNSSAPPNPSDVGEMPASLPTLTTSDVSAPGPVS